MVFIGTWFTAEQPSESGKTDEPGDEEGAAAKAAAVLKSAADKARPAATKAGEMAVAGAKKAAEATASGAKWFSGKVKDFLESRRAAAEPDSDEQAPVEGEGEDEPEA